MKFSSQKKFEIPLTSPDSEFSLIIVIHKKKTKHSMQINYVAMRLRNTSHLDDTCMPTCPPKNQPHHTVPPQRHMHAYVPA